MEAVKLITVNRFFFSHSAFCIAVDGLVASMLCTLEHFLSPHQHSVTSASARQVKAHKGKKKRGTSSLRTLRYDPCVLHSAKCCTSTTGGGIISRNTLCAVRRSPPRRTKLSASVPRELPFMSAVHVAGQSVYQACISYCCSSVFFLLFFLLNMGSTPQYSIVAYLAPLVFFLSQDFCAPLSML